MFLIFIRGRLGARPSFWQNGSLVFGSREAPSNPDRGRP
jgi:hypothetical protein